MKKTILWTAVVVSIALAARAAPAADRIRAASGGSVQATVFSEPYASMAVKKLA